MSGTTDVEGVMDSMTPEQFDDWAAYDCLEPLCHTERMLGMLVLMISQYLGHKDIEALEAIVTPWIDQNATSTPEQIRQSIRKG